MKYNLSNPIDAQKFKERCNKLFTEKAFVRLDKINLERSIPQNSYLHLLLGWYACEYGETIDYVKEYIYKRKVNKAIFETEFLNRKTGELRKGWRSTSVLDTAEMTLSIDRFRDYSSKEAGIYLPQPNEREFIKQIQVDMEKHKNYI